jgi:hypothetical protein
MPGPGSSPGQALVPGIHDLNADTWKTWMAGTSPDKPGHGVFKLNGSSTERHPPSRIPRGRAFID